MFTFKYTTKLVVTVYGVFSHGHKAGQTNPEMSVTATFYGACFKHAFRRMKDAVGDAFYVISRTETGDFGDSIAYGEEAQAIENDLREQEKSDERYAKKVANRRNRRIIHDDEIDITDPRTMGYTIGEIMEHVRATA